jgi:hypothetical protein
VPESQCPSAALPAPLPAANDAATSADATTTDATVPTDAAAPDATPIVDAAVPDAADAATDGG